MRDLDVQFFLQLGYFPSYKPVYVLNAPNSLFEEMGDDDLIEKSRQLFQEAIAGSYKSQNRNIIPLSGGLDSRAILAGLLECTEARNLETYTFGTPGTYDFDIGCLVAREAGTKHKVIDLSSYDWQERDFFEAAERSDYQTFLFHQPPVDILKQYEEGLIWSGYIGDLVTGGHLKKLPSMNLEEAKERYLSNRREIRSMELNIFVDSLSDFIGQDILPHDNLSFDEQIMFSEVSRITAPHVLMKGFNYVTPFINNGFYDFFMGLPSEYRFEQNLFKSMALRYFPTLFNLPCKNAYGLTLQSPPVAKFMRRGWNKGRRIIREHLRFIHFPALPMTNYFDVDGMLRRNQIFAAIIQKHLRDLRVRNIVPNIDIDKIWQRHMMRKANHGDAIKILFSLEINLKGKGL